jgi:hypothetical protein
LWPGNLFAWELFQKLSGQVITGGMGDILGIKFEAIESLFNIYGIMDNEERLILFEKITSIDEVRIRMRSDEIRSNMKSKKSK